MFPVPGAYDVSQGREPTNGELIARRKELLK